MGESLCAPLFEAKSSNPANAASSPEINAWILDLGSMDDQLQEIRGAGATNSSACCRSLPAHSVPLGEVTHHYRMRSKRFASLARSRQKTYYFLAMALIPIKTASETGYCDCICGCYELASLRDDDTGKSYCPACAKDHVDLNAGAGVPQPAPMKASANSASGSNTAAMPSPADPPGRLR
jgi:hypothetical protein